MSRGLGQKDLRKKLFGLKGFRLLIIIFSILRLQRISLDEHYASMVLIHGVGEGQLKALVYDILKNTAHVKSFGPGDPARYGNGATKVIFQ